MNICRRDHRSPRRLLWNQQCFVKTPRCHRLTERRLLRVTSHPAKKTKKLKKLKDPLKRLGAPPLLLFIPNTAVSLPANGALLKSNVTPRRAGQHYRKQSHNSLPHKGGRRLLKSFSFTKKNRQRETKGR